jgi:hypothetical protein
VDEVNTNPNLILAVEGEGSEASYSVVGAENSKAWVRGVKEVVVFQSIPIPIHYGEQQIAEFRVQDWQFEMDSVRFELEGGTKKLQGVAVNKVLAAADPTTPYTTVTFSSEDGAYECALASIQQDDSIRIFINITGYEMKYLVGTIQGQVFLENITRIDLQ